MVTIEARLLDDPRTFHNGNLFYLDRVRVTSYSNINLQYGDLIRAKGLIEQDKFANTKNDHFIWFGTKKYIMRNPKIERVFSQNPLFFTASFVRQKVTGVFNAYLSPRLSGLLLGIVFGVREGIDKEFKRYLAQTGVLHVVAASGMNVSMLGGFLLTFSLFFFPRHISLFVTSLGIVFYAFLSGLAPSILRATLMAIFSYVGLFWGRQNTAFVSLCLAAFLILFSDPIEISDIGFQLSFLSTLGIMLFTPIIELVLAQLRLPKSGGILQDVSTTLSAQAGSLPVLVNAFSSYSLFSIVINPLLLWTIPYLMVFGGAAAVLSLLFPVLAVPFLYLCLPLLVFFEKTVFFFGERFPAFSLPALPLIFWIGYYFVVLAVALFVQNKKVGPS